MRAVLIVGPGSNQRALACRLGEVIPLAAIAVVTPAAKGRRRLLRSAVSLTLARGLRSAWAAMMAHYDRDFPGWPDARRSEHGSANDEALVAMVANLHPDLVLVSGTDLLKDATIRRLGAPVMNLHTGISPYIKGAPNCTNWALALNEPEMIGSTIMWIDAGIDTGAIIATEQAPVTGREPLAELHVKVMDHAHDLYCRAVAAFVSGNALEGVPQSTLGKGRLFLSKHWDARAMLRAVFNHRFRMRSRRSEANVRLVALP